MAIKIELKKANGRYDRIEPVIDFTFNMKNQEQDPISINYLFYDVNYNTIRRRVYLMGRGIYFPTYPGAGDKRLEDV